MICKVKATIGRYGMLRDSRSVIVGVSGGADSCALLHILCALKDEMSLKITAAHVNHGIRGEEADRDEEFVKAFCKRLGVKLEILHADIPALARETGQGLEECGRSVRYEFFESIDPDALIATAHNLNDCCETLIFNLTRGTSVKGLSSIPPVRGRVIRPLIECSRAEIERYCRDNNIDYVTDSTNADDNYSRNRIRLNVIPELKMINPSFESAAARLMMSARQDDDCLSALAAELVEKASLGGSYNAELLENAHPAIRNRALARIVTKELSYTPETADIQKLSSILVSGKTQLRSGVEVSVKSGVLTFGKKELTPAWSVQIQPGEEAETPFGSAEITIIHKKEPLKIQFVHKNVLDFERTVGQLVLRSRLAGDEIKIAGRNCTKTIKKLFVEAKITDKNSVCILADELGPVWVEGFGCCERCAITKDTVRALKVNVKRG